MNVIFNSGHVIKNVELLDKTRSPVGLLIWAQKQNYDPVLTFNRLSVKSSQVAGLEFDDDELKKYKYNKNNTDFKPEDMPWNNNYGADN